MLAALTATWRSVLGAPDGSISFSVVGVLARDAGDHARTIEKRDIVLETSRLGNVLLGFGLQLAEALDERERSAPSGRVGFFRH